jgi:hypothetical protein
MGRIGFSWNKPNPVTELTYRVENSPSHTDCHGPHEVEDLLANACDKWKNVSAFMFTKTSDRQCADIVFKFGTVTETGPSGVAHVAQTQKTSTDCPSKSHRALITFSNAITWTSARHVESSQWAWTIPILIPLKPDEAKKKYDLLTVALHEVGHVLNLDDDPHHPESLMRPEIDQGAIVFVMRGRLPDCDAAAVAQEWGANIKTFAPVDPGDYMVVGGRMNVTDLSTGAPLVDLECHWGLASIGSIREQLVAEGYCWNRVVVPYGRSYGRVYFNLVPKTMTQLLPANTPILLGGHSDYRTLDSKSSPRTKRPNDPADPGTQWGLDAASTQLLGHMEGWDPYNNRLGYIRYWGTVAQALGTVPYTPLLGGRMEFWNGGKRTARPPQKDTANRWPKGQTGSGTEVKWADYIRAHRVAWQQPWADSFLTFQSH